MYDVVFLDFDGVVVESANIKTQAFYEIYLTYGKEVAIQAQSYHLSNQGVSRYKKFEAIHKLLFNQSCSEEKKQVLSQKFSEIVLKKIIEAPLVDGALEFLKKMNKKSIPVYLLSATPHEELKRICQKKEIIHYFKAVYGASFEKHEVGIKILTENNFSKENAIFIGDSVSDYQASTLIEVPFIGRVPKDEQNPFDSNIPVIQNFATLLV
jgi:phosphoglycolate phosphatase-like HAD superfamily hydrolase